jgi:hypothetical protein
MNRRLTPAEIATIKELLTGCADVPATVERLAERFGVSRDRIYAHSRAVREVRKPRKDKGKRAADLKSHPVLKLAASLVVAKNLDPELALETACLNHPEFGNAPVTVETFRRYLREHGIDAKLRRNPTLHVRFEARFPLEVCECDWTALKERWRDEKTRNILRIPGSDERNHPLTDPRYERVWMFSYKDKHSRRWFLRAIVGRVPTQSDTLDCLLEAFAAWGIPQILYTDNGSELAGPMIRLMARLLNQALSDGGGFALQQHAPRNARATGTVEQSNQTSDRFNRLLSLVDGKELDLVQLNRFLDNYCARYNDREHRSTGVAPNFRYRAGVTSVRTLPVEITSDLFKCKPFENVLIRPDLTVQIEGRPWKLPHEEPFITAGLRKTKVTVYWPQLRKTSDQEFEDRVGWFVVERPAVGEIPGWEVKVTRVPYQAHAHGEFKSIPQSAGQQLAEELKEHAREVAKPGALVVPLFHTTDAERGAGDDRVAVLPPRRIETDPTLLGVFGLSGQPAAPEVPTASFPATVHEFPAPAQHADTGELLDLRSAKRWLLDEGLLTPPISDIDAEWLASVFGQRSEVTTDEIRAALDARARQPRLRVVG